MVATADTVALVSGYRISSVTSSPSMTTRSWLAEVSMSNRQVRATSMASSGLAFGSIPRWATRQATARYIDPVSRWATSSRLATPREVDDLPDPLGPSMAMTRGEGDTFCLPFDDDPTRRDYRHPPTRVRNAPTSHDRALRPSTAPHDPGRHRWTGNQPHEPDHAPPTGPRH